MPNLLSNQVVGEHLTSNLGCFGVIAALPFVFGMAMAFSVEATFLLLFLGVPLVLLCLSMLTLIRTWHGIRDAREETGVVPRIALVLLAPALFVATLLSSLPILWAGDYVGTLLRLAVNQHRYEAIIDTAKEHPKPAWYEEEGGITYSVDVGPPIRVAFNPEGFLDNWSGIVFDPTGEIMQADGFDAKTGEFVAPERITKLFGGDLMSCRHLWGDYYDCSFT